ncbi:MAG: Na(+)-translocating NADH-quinone reductase subunit A [Saprospiraceae bacterium]|nr:Na(+)-translocating NADH-quinone reductase subunit A [Saprospiraceae bacterium]
MDIRMNKRTITLSLTFLAQILSAEPSTASSGSGILLYSVVAVCAVLVVWAMLSLAGNLLKIEASKYGMDPEKNGIGIFPGVKDFFKPAKPGYINDGSFHLLTKGHDIKLAGEASGDIKPAHVTRFGINPKDFHGMSPIPKVILETGAEVKAGDILFYDKKRPEIMYAAPVSGEVVEIRRGEKRSIDEIVILADKTIKYKKFKIIDINKADRNEIVTFMLETGLWTLINERPFDVVPDIDSVPVNIFVSTFDTAPLAIDYNKVISGNEAVFQAGLDVLSKLTEGKVHLGLDSRGKTAPSSAFTNAMGAEKHWFKGPHPAGNVGIHIHHIAPIKGQDKVWTLGVQEVVTIGKMILTGEYHADRVVALTGSQLNNAGYVRTYQGAGLGDLLKNNLIGENNRVVSGDVLSGTKSSLDGFLGFRDDQVTVLKEGNEYELLGWLLPLTPRPSISGTIPSYGSDTKFEANTNTHGEKRAFVVSGQYESVLPMDIYPQHLMKAIITNNIEKMEALGLAELTEEDVALCEFVCTSKNPVQSILRQGLDSLKEQL